MDGPQLQEALWRLLRCPCCRSSLTKSPLTLTCDGSERHLFPLVRGVPILIDETRSLFSTRSFLEGTQGGGRPKGIRAFARRYLPSLTYNVAGKKNATTIMSLVPATVERPLALNIGGKHPEAALRHILSGSRLTTIELDVSLNPATQVIGDAWNLPFPDSTFDLVVIDSVLEHLLNPQTAADEIHRVLKPQGVVYADSPFMMPVHGGAFDFVRFSPVAHRHLFARFKEYDSGVSTGPGAALAYSILYFCMSFFERQTPRMLVKAGCNLLFFWLKYFDVLLARKPGAHDSAHGIYFIGLKIDRTVSSREILESYFGSTPNLYERGMIRRVDKRK